MIKITSCRSRKPAFILAAATLLAVPVIALIIPTTGSAGQQNMPSVSDTCAGYLTRPPGFHVLSFPK